ncbi:hypothetical protein M9H77_25515 [Catharanthus roseus]|uniref:Uncharacterized protein n=1 Tax=Catharanthus roseus TaxID=4058 RepID=A0ACC0A8D2_CATRO|nr:hypothetical protein M9H77_25515 [Catharanthus roseus]
MTRARMKKLKASNGEEDNGMVASRIIQGNNLMVKLAKYGREGILSLTIALPLPSPVGFCQAMLGNLISTTNELNLKILNRGSSREGGDAWEGVESKLQSKVDLH